MSNTKWYLVVTSYKLLSRCVSMNEKNLTLHGGGIEAIE